MSDASPWDGPGSDLPPVADRTGPFPHPQFLQAVWRHRPGPGREAVPLGTSDAFLPLARHPGGLAFAGDPDLVDYRSPLGDPAAATEMLAAYLTETERGTRLLFDSLPGEAAAPVAKAMAEAGLPVEAEEHEVAATLTLPDDFDHWLGAIGAKERHELRRKTRRFEASLGTPRLERHQGPGEAFDAFLTMHRRAGGAKGSFMTSGGRGLFQALIRQPGWQIDLLAGQTGPVAAAFAYEDAEGYYLYNSAYDPDRRDASPGIVLLGKLIERSVGSGRAVFDFLKGGETYKFRLGAEPRPLYRLHGTR